MVHVEVWYYGKVSAETKESMIPDERVIEYMRGLRVPESKQELERDFNRVFAHDFNEVDASTQDSKRVLLDQLSHALNTFENNRGVVLGVPVDFGGPGDTPRSHTSLSMGDVVGLDGEYYVAVAFGYEKLTMSGVKSNG